MIKTVLAVAVMVTATTVVAIWGFRPGWYRVGPKLTRVLDILAGVWASFLFVAAWAVFLPLAPAVSLGSGRIVVGVFAIACLAVTLVAVTKRQSATGKPWWKVGTLDHPSLAELLPSGVFMANDDYNDRMVAIDPATGALVWQYGITGTPGTAPGELNTPDGFDLLLPDGQHAT